MLVGSLRTAAVMASVDQSKLRDIRSSMTSVFEQGRSITKKDRFLKKLSVSPPSPPSSM